MRIQQAFAFIGLLCGIVLVPATLNAVPITTGTGPGGVETTAGVGSTLDLWLTADSITGLFDTNPVTSWSNLATHAGAASNATKAASERKLVFWVRLILFSSYKMASATTTYARSVPNLNCMNSMG